MLIHTASPLGKRSQIRTTPFEQGEPAQALQTGRADHSKNSTMKKAWRIVALVSSAGVKRMTLRVAAQTTFVANVRSLVAVFALGPLAVAISASSHQRTRRIILGLANDIPPLNDHARC